MIFVSLIALLLQSGSRVIEPPLATTSEVIAGLDECIGFFRKPASAKNRWLSSGWIDETNDPAVQPELRGKDEAGIVSKGGLALLFASAKEAAAAKQSVKSNTCILTMRPAAETAEVLRSIASKYGYKQVSASKAETVLFLAPDFQIMIERPKADPTALRATVANFRGNN